MTYTPNLRLRRMRQHPQLRRLMRETNVTPADLIAPLFIHHGKGVNNPISSMPGQHQYSIDQLGGEIKALRGVNIPAVILFGLPDHKDALGTAAYDDHGVIQQAIPQIKEMDPELLVIADLCFCEYTDHGHCGAINVQGDNFTLDNDKTLNLLGQQAVSLARAGADVIAPSGMIDGMVAAIRDSLDQAGFCDIPIMSYSIKYASSFYGPFREAADGAPMMGDRSSYQMDPANAEEAAREAQLDVIEGADMLMVKPAMNYLDIIYRTKQAHPEIPLAAYQVSGEYAMIKAAAQNGWLNEDKVVAESLLAIKRAGADMIITYFAKQFSQKL